MRRYVMVTLAIVVSLVTGVLASAGPAAADYPPAPPTVIVVSGQPSTDGIPVTVTGLEPGSTLTITYCRVDPATHALVDCRTVTVIVGPDGTAHTTLPTPVPGDYVLQFSGTKADGSPFTATANASVTGPTPTPTATPTPSPTVVRPTLTIAPNPTTETGIVVTVTGMRPNSSVTVTWCQIVGPHGSDDDTPSCRTTQLPVDANGVARGTLPTLVAGQYSVTVVGTDAAGLPFNQTVVVTVAEPAAKQLDARATAVSHASKMRVRVYTKCSGQFSFRVQKRVIKTKASSVEQLATVTWRTYSKKYRTAGSKKQKTVNLKKGTYRARVYGRCGYETTYTNTVTLKK